VVVKLDGKFALCAVCSTDVIDFNKLAAVAGVELAELATEAEVAAAFPGVQVGAVPPFGCLYGMPLYLDCEVGNWPVAGDGDVVFCAGAGWGVGSCSRSSHLLDLLLTPSPRRHAHGERDHALL